MLETACFSQQSVQHGTKGLAFQAPVSPDVQVAYTRAAGDSLAVDAHFARCVESKQQLCGVKMKMKIMYSSGFCAIKATLHPMRLGTSS
jgi:hypothetical protein